VSSVWVFETGMIPRGVNTIYATRAALEREFEECGYTILPREGGLYYERVTIGKYFVGTIQEHEVVA